MLHKGYVNHYLADPKQIKEALIQTQPTLMAAVPRFMKKFTVRFMHKSIKLADQTGFISFVCLGRQNALTCPLSKLVLMPLNALLDAIVFKKIAAY